ncbi:MAG TPA: ABC transporter permease, partial [Spirochaetia bacterium]|nr:ABC transporter permease [Spirochaetia bacterium]
MSEKKKNLVAENLREFGLLLFIIVLCILVQLRNASFLTVQNIMDILTNTAILSILSLGMMMVLITRGIDLSIGATIAFSGMVTALTVSRYPGLSPFIAILEGMALGGIFGAIIGMLVAKFSILPIIASLGMMNIIRGLTYIVSGGKWVSSYQMSTGFKLIATGKTLGLNNLIVIAVVLHIIFYYFINHTRTGRRIYAVGSNPEAAEISGIPKTEIIWLVYTLMGVIA